MFKGQNFLFKDLHDGSKIYRLCNRIVNSRGKNYVIDNILLFGVRFLGYDE